MAWRSALSYAILLVSYDISSSRIMIYVRKKWVKSSAGAARTPRTTSPTWKRCWTSSRTTMMCRMSGTTGTGTNQLLLSKSRCFQCEAAGCFSFFDNTWYSYSPPCVQCVSWVFTTEPAVIYHFTVCFCWNYRIYKKCAEIACIYIHIYV